MFTYYKFCSIVFYLNFSKESGNVVQRTVTQIPDEILNNVQLQEAVKQVSNTVYHHLTSIVFPTKLVDPFI